MALSALPGASQRRGLWKVWRIAAKGPHQWKERLSQWVW